MPITKIEPSHRFVLKNDDLETEMLIFACSHEVCKARFAIDLRTLQDHAMFFYCPICRLSSRAVVPLADSWEKLSVV